jgi:iron complex transport system substrate-binding protein
MIRETARQTAGRAAALCLSLALTLALPSSLRAGELGPRSEPALRIVSLNPSLTEILIALGASESLVGVDAYSAQVVPQAAHLPQVGGLYNPSLEAVIGVEPDRVVVVESVEQRDFRRRLEQLGIPVSVFQNHTFDQVLANIRDLGELVGRSDEAERRIAEVRRVWRRARQLSQRYPPRRTVLVIQRDPLFVVTPKSYIGQMLESVGAENPAAEFGEPYPRVAVEWLLAAAPEVLIDLSADPESAADYWGRWPGLPAVSSNRVLQVDARKVSIPGPYLDRSIAILAGAVHGLEFRLLLEEGPRLESDSGPEAVATVESERPLSEAAGDVSAGSPESDP